MNGAGAAGRRALAARPYVRDAVVADYAARLEAFLLRQDGVFANIMRGNERHVA